MTMPDGLSFLDRFDAGRRLGAELAPLGRAHVFDIERLADATDWLRREPDGVDTRIGYLGAKAYNFDIGGGDRP
jgi:hypothetical protein